MSESARTSETVTGPQRVAEEAAAAMRAADRAARAAGVDLSGVAPGRATATMTVGDDHANGHGICHGGYLFLLADAAMAYASNAHGVSAVASGADITFLRPARTGDVLVAEAVERALAGRSGLYDVTVRIANGPDGPDGPDGSAGEVVAEFRGRTRQVPGLAPPPA
ncbi:hydroxyphenylacetyl-CoA thioesterase PaaI [Pseudonocardia nematodicida]|uniref:Hydroxyphenylacetyl-CoA thioesterase PaaI n=1 Tax=Pseudonocardia nematodicida TaxID=1206997 RepID=A0ABV1KKG9_9PSEU